MTYGRGRVARPFGSALTGRRNRRASASVCARLSLARTERSGSLDAEHGVRGEPGIIADESVGDQALITRRGNHEMHMRRPGFDPPLTPCPPCPRSRLPWCHPSHPVARPTTRSSALFRRTKTGSGAAPHHRRARSAARPGAVTAPARGRELDPSRQGNRLRPRPDADRPA